MRHVLETLESRLLLTHPCYSVFFEREPNDSLDESNAVVLDRCDESQPGAVFFRPVEGRLETTNEQNGDVDLFRFQEIEPNVDRRIELTFYGDAAHEGFVPQLLDANGRLLAAAAGHDTDSDGTPDSATLEYVARLGDQFFVQVGPGPHADVPGQGNGAEFFPAVNISTGDVYTANFGATEFRYGPPTGFNSGWYEPHRQGPSFAEWNPDDRQANIMLTNGNLTAETSFPTSGVNDFESYGAGDVIGVAVDLDHNRAYFSKNGVWQGDADPSLLAGGLEMGRTPGFPEFFPAINISTGDVYTANFGGEAFRYQPPAAFNPGWFETHNRDQVFAEWNPADRQENIRLSNNNLTAETMFPSGYAYWHSDNDSVRATMGKTDGKWYFEVFVAARSYSGYNAIGTATKNLWLEITPGADDNGCGYQASGFVQCKLRSITTTLPPTDPHSDNDSVRATIGQTTGKWYFEVLVAARSVSGYNAIGTATKELWLEVTPGADDNGCGYQASGYVQCKRREVSTSYESYGAGDVIGVAVDLDHNRAYFSKNGVWQGGADPNTLRGGLVMGGATAVPSHADLPYTLTVEVTPELPPDEESHVEAEPNNSFDQANVIELFPAGGGVESNHAARTGGQPGEKTHSGSVTGELENPTAAQCWSDQPPAFCAVIDLAPDLDFYTFDVVAGHVLRVVLDGSLAGNDGTLTLYDQERRPLVWEADSADGISINWTVQETGSFFVRVLGNAGTINSPSNPTDYVLRISAGPAADPIEGRDEYEPNDTPAQGNELQLEEFPTFAPGLGLRGGNALGIAGGPSGDTDVFQIFVRAGEHVAAEVQEHSPARRDASPPGNREGSLHSLNVTVFDSAGNEVGDSPDTNSGVETFNSTSDSTYYVTVSANADGVGNALLRYRLAVLARSGFDLELLPKRIEAGPNGEVLEPMVVVLGAGQPFSFTDSTGDRVQIQLHGRGGHATITFTGSNAEGSDIASVQIDGVRRGGNLSIQADGGAEVGMIAIHSALAGPRRRGGGRAGFDTVRVDGNVGMISSVVDVRSLVIDGVLGEINAPSRRINELHARTFDSAMSDVGSIHALHVDENFADALFNRYLPFDEPAT